MGVFCGSYTRTYPSICSHAVVCYCIIAHAPENVGISNVVHTELVADQHFLPFVNGDHVSYWTKVYVVLCMAMSNYTESAKFFVCNV
jgi:hypothetical protein